MKRDPIEAAREPSMGMVQRATIDAHQGLRRSLP